jgi:hypothetical protein
MTAEQPADELSDSTLQLNLGLIAASVCAIGVIPLLLTGNGRALPLALVAAAAFYIGGRFGWRSLLARAWHYNDDAAPGAIFLTHLYVVVCCVVLLLLLLQILFRVYSPAPSY